MKKFPTCRLRDWILIAVGFALIFGSGFAASNFYGEPKTATEVVPLGQWEGKALQNLRQQIKVRPEQEEQILDVLHETQTAIKDTRQRASLEFHLHLLDTHAKLAPYLDADQRRTMRTSSEALAEKIREQFPEYLEGDAVPEIEELAP